MPSLTAVEPVAPVAPWLGGKRNLAKRIVARIDAIDHATYAEPFVGMGGIFLRRTRCPGAEVINDFGRDVANLFRILQRHYTPFMEMLRYQITSRREFERLALEDVRTLTDLERAARFLYLQRTAFGGKVAGRTFGVDVTGGGRFNVTSLAPALEDLHERLAGVIIENLDWAEFIPRYDRPGTLFYLDPPYWGCETDYGPGFERGDFARLADLLSGLQGRFILSLNDVPEVRELFAWAKIDAIETTYTIGQNKGKKAGELVISTP